MAEMNSGRRPALPLTEILESAPDAVVGIDAAGLIVFANRQICRLFGYDPDELVGQPVETLLPTRFHAAHRGHRARYLADPVTRPMGAGLELAGRRRDGSEFPVDISLSAIETSDGLIATAFVRDLTDRKRSEAMFRGLLDGAADAIVVIDSGGAITLVNRQVHALFGYAPDELIGQPVELLVPERFREVHPMHRATYLADPRVRAMGAKFELAARRKDGSEFPVDIALAPFDTGSGTWVSASVRDVSERRQAEHDAQELREAQIRRRQALEINDSVVQGVATAVYALGRSDTGYALSALSATLESARLMMDRLLERAEDAPATSLVREQPALVLAEATAPPDRAASAHAESLEELITVVVADDTPDMRLVLRLALSEDSGFRVVGEAGDGRAAVEQAGEHQPDVVIVDLAMPVMDGLTAIPNIRKASPNSRVVVLSGYGADDMQDLALAAGADAYVTKGRPTDSLIALLRELVPVKAAPAESRRPAEPDDPLDTERDAVTDLALSVTAHELATPVTVTLGMLDQLRGRMDTLPSTVVDEMMAAVERNVRHISELLTLLNDVRHVGREALTLDRTHLDLPTLVRDTLRDLMPALADRAVTVDAPERISVSADPVRIRQVLTNLLTNAVKFSPPGSPIEITITALLGTVELTVTDHGTGIADEERPRLFTKFTRLSADTSGMGLGLYLSRGIARAHGGELRLARSSRDGSTFALALPVAVIAGAAPGAVRADPR
jgi:PAS domain S-box-containing protein